MIERITLICYIVWRALLVLIALCGRLIGTLVGTFVGGLVAGYEQGYKG